GAQLLGIAGLVGSHDDVGLPREVVEDAPALWVREVQRERALAPVGGGEVGRAVGGGVLLRQLPAPRHVAAGGWVLDLDDLGAQLGEELADAGPSEYARQLDDEEVGEGHGRGG